MNDNAQAWIRTVAVCLVAIGYIVFLVVSDRRSQKMDAEIRERMGMGGAGGSGGLRPVVLVASPEGSIPGAGSAKGFSN
jgi:hypothetical protein